MTKQLSKAQWRALTWLAQGREFSVRNARFATLENLRKRGFAERESSYVMHAVYADKNGEHRQPAWRGWWHRWFITDLGRSALQPPATEKKG